MVNRREFLRVVLPAGALTLAAAGLAVKRLTMLNPNRDPDETSFAYAQDLSTNAPSATETVVQTTPEVDLTAAPAQATQIASSPAVAVAPCTVRCNRGCSFPGRCRRYTDSNNNNRCDLGECL